MENGRLAGKLEKPCEFRALEKRPVVPAQLAWLCERLHSVEQEAATLLERRQAIEQETEKQVGRLTERQRGQLPLAKALCVSS